MTRQAAPAAVVGLGAVGEALLRLLHGAGHDVTGIDRDPQALARAERALKEAGTRLTGDAAEPGGPPGPPDRAPDFRLTDDLTALARAELVIEAVPDDRETKREVLRAIGAACPAGAVLVTTAVTVPLMAAALASGRPERTVGLRLFTPPAPGGPAEVVRTALTSDEAVGAVGGLLARLGLAPVTVGAGPARDAEALVLGLLNRAVALLEQGDHTADAIDTAMRLGCGLPAGPLRLLDTMGAGTVHAVLADLWEGTGDAYYRPAPLLARMAAEHRLGNAPMQDLTAPGRRGAGDAAEDGGAGNSAEDAAEGGGAAPVRRVAVVGSGTMGRGIAEVTATAGFPTVLVARSPAKAAGARETVEGSLTRAVRRGRIEPAAKARALTLLTTTDDPAAIADCDLVIEAVAEDTEVKKALFARLGSLCAPGALLATTTSSLSVAECTAPAGRAGDTLGLHFFNPAPAMRLVELVTPPDTAPGTVARARAFCARLRRTTVDCPDTAGFIVNRLLFPYLGAAVRLLARPDTDAAAVDAAVTRGFGFPLGPFALLDTVGLDVSLAIQRRLHERFPAPETEPPALLVEAVAQGLLGRKNGRGLTGCLSERRPGG
ncbi:3-hydroxyacyl-CoA dehydrogenase family protein [Streptomyces sp. NPDC053542]|uniref:3-hydroxyacyl-CoA dehydrogenase family protein n=1 Tax=Streptomyces sp. NPDC053542 TaxID=3365710 RepID=UPI0037D5FDFD